MSRFRKIIAGVIALTLLIAIVGCGNSSDKDPADKGEKVETVTLKLGHIASITNPWHLASQRFAEIVEEKTDGNVKIEIYSDSQIGGEKDMAEGMQMGTVDMAILGTGTLGKLEPTMEVFGLPYLFRDRDHLNKVLHGPVGEEVFETTIESTQIRGLAFWERGPRYMTNSKHPVKTPEDVEGLKIRTPPEEMSMEIWRVMGAGPTPMEFGELFTALQQKVVDGQENPVSLIASSNFQEVQKYISLTSHTWAPAVICISDKVFADLPEEYQTIIKEAALEAAEYEAELVLEEEETMIKKLADEGMEVIEVDMEAFAEATKDVHLKFDDIYGRELYERIINVK